ncbi:hypothetical protein [Methylomonas koyamae]|uniref:hypothetical protein n=1 Tax=Methylomonas koyamae TaxID=702114 RepID=UPI001642DB96|nr:hypothetical protein [Methylomonas koyamae]
MNSCTTISIEAQTNRPLFSKIPPGFLLLATHFLSGPSTFRWASDIPFSFRTKSAAAKKIIDGYA